MDRADNIRRIKAGADNPGSDAQRKKEYKKKSKDFRESNPICQIKSPVCTGQTNGVHHKAGKIGDLLNDEKYWMAACNPCNGWIEDNDAEARKLGFKISKHIKK
jgi:hypothetical protein